MPLLDAQSFDCMHSILQSIDLVVGFFGYGIHQGKPASQLSYEGTDEAIWDHTISSLLLKKLFGVFPLNPTNHLSEKVNVVIRFEIIIFASKKPFFFKFDSFGLVLPLTSVVYGNPVACTCIKSSNDGRLWCLADVGKLHCFFMILNYEHNDDVHDFGCINICYPSSFHCLYHFFFLFHFWEGLHSQLYHSVCIKCSF